MPHVSVNYAIIDSVNGLVPNKHQAIIWTNCGSMLIGCLGTTFSQIWIKIQHVHSMKWICICRLQNGSHFVSASIYQTISKQAEQLLYKSLYITAPGNDEPASFSFFNSLTSIMRDSLGRGLSHLLLTHWGREKMAANLQTALSNTFSWMKLFEFRFKFHWSLFLRVQLTIFQHWFR